MEDQITSTHLLNFAFIFKAGQFQTSIPFVFVSISHRGSAPLFYTSSVPIFKYLFNFIFVLKCNFFF